MLRFGVVFGVQFIVELDRMNKSGFLLHEDRTLLVHYSDDEFVIGSLLIIQQQKAV